MKRRSVLKLLAAPALMTVARPAFAQGKEKITYAYLLDPAYDAVTWAMMNGKVKSDLITVEARGLAIPQLIQATSAKQYDVLMTAVIGIPPAVAHGLDLRVMGTALQLADRIVLLSKKPTRVLEIVQVDAKRPRALSDGVLAGQRVHLMALFRSLETETGS